MIYLCTFFDYRYLDKGLSLHFSLVRQGHPFHLWILCMDSDTRETLARIDLPNVSLVTIDDLASHDPAILTAKGSRSLVEFYFTSKSFLCLYILGTQPHVDLLTYLDADAYFFDNPVAIVREMEGCSIGLTPHRFPPHLISNMQFGRFNAGFISIRRNSAGLECLTWWRNNCYSWCHDYVSEGRFADQGYLDAIPESFTGVRIIDHKGMNAAPWNITQYAVSLNEGRIMIDDDPLVLYHFHGIKKLGLGIFESGLSTYRGRTGAEVRRLIYRPYLEVLFQQHIPDSPLLSKASIRISAGRLDMLKRFLPPLWKFMYLLKDVVTGLYYRSLIVMVKR